MVLAGQVSKENQLLVPQTMTHARAQDLRRPQDLSTIEAPTIPEDRCLVPGQDFNHCMLFGDGWKGQSHRASRHSAYHILPKVEWEI